VIPIVFVTAADPVRTGLVASLNRPEGNVTGVNMVGATLEGKRLELLHKLVPEAKRLGALVNPRYPVAKAQEEELRAATARLGLDLVLLNAGTPDEVELAMATFAERRVGAVLIANDPFLGSERERLAALALHYRLPSMSFRREFADAGGLLSYGAHFEEGYRQAGVYAASILKGARTTNLPVLQPKI
jgi:putative ABC transport system substrate-binding protein